MNQYGGFSLKRTLSSVETWGFGLTGLLLWIGVAPGANSELGTTAIFVWLISAIIGVLINFQVKKLGENLPDMSGGTPNYTTVLLKKYPFIATYATLGYYISWVAVVPVNAIIITDLITDNLAPLGIIFPKLLLNIILTLLPFIVAFSGTRAISILHLVFVIPSICFLLAFSVQGVGWLAFSPESPGFFPSHWSSFSFSGWAKWYLNATYAVYACESASQFVADSQKPKETLRSLMAAAVLIPIIYIGGSWVVMRLATNPDLKSSAFANLLASSQGFWGESASFFVTFLLISSSLLACATAVSNTPRFLYQLSIDGYLSPLFSVVSRQGVFGPGLLISLSLSLICLVWADLDRIVMITGVGWLFCFIALHWGLWLNRNAPNVLFPRLSLVFCVLEIVVLFVGGWAWNPIDLLIGLLLPAAILLGDKLIFNQMKIPLFSVRWWNKIYRRSRPPIEDFLALEVVVLILLICSAIWIGWFFGIKVGNNTNVSANLLVIILFIIAFVGVAIAAWTSLPQVVALSESKEQSEHLFYIAIDGILVVNEKGIIIKANPAAIRIISPFYDNTLIKSFLNQILPELEGIPENWHLRNEHILQTESEQIILETAISNRFDQDFREYVVILRDITAQKQAETTLRDYNQTLENKVQERTAEIARANAEIVMLNNQLKSENLRMGTELAITKRLQEMILPKAHELTEIPDLDIAGFMKPASEVGGDYYDVLQHNGRVKIGIGDVTGHGLESGVLMIMVQTAVRTLLENNETDYRKILDTINRTIYNNVQRMDSDKNLTLSLLDYKEGSLFLSGQHEEIIVIRKEGGVERIDTIDLGFPIGLEQDISHFVAEAEIKLNPGDVVVLYTDGITEAENHQGQYYGLERLIAKVQENSHFSADEIRQKVIQDVLDYIGEHKVYDDITLLVIKQKESKSS